MGWFTKKIVPQNVQQIALQSPNTRFKGANWAFTYERKRLPGPGAQNYAYELLGLVEFSPIGPAERNRLQWQVVQPSPQYAGFDLYLQGVGGLSQGTMYSAPLIDPSSPYGSGASPMEVSHTSEQL